MTDQDYECMCTIYSLLGRAMSDAQEILEREQQKLDTMPLRLTEVNLQTRVKRLRTAVDNMDLAHGELTVLLMETKSQI